MIVQLGRRYAYVWDGPDDEIHVGDLVLIPPTWVDGLRGKTEPSTGRVTEVNFVTDYPGELTHILRKLTTESPE